MSLQDEWESAKPSPLQGEWETAVPSRKTPKQMKDMLPPIVSGRLGVHGVRSPRVDPGSPLDIMERSAYETGGDVTDVARRMGASPETAAGAGTLANVSLQAIPNLLGGGFAAGRSAAPLMRSGAESLMQSALKPSLKQLKTGQAATAIETMLDEGINVSKGGVAKLRDKVSTLNEQIRDAISSSKQTIARGDVGQELMNTLHKFSEQVNPESDMAAIRKAWEEFKNHPLFKGKADIPVQTAQTLKQGTYKQLSKKYGEMGSADIEAQKALARGLKQQIAEKVPQISGLNEQESKLITTLNIAEKRALMQLNNNPASLAWLAHSPTTFAMFIADKSSLFKSMLARMMNYGQRGIPAVAGQAAGGMVSLSDIGRQNEDAGSSARPY